MGVPKVCSVIGNVTIGILCVASLLTVFIIGIFLESYTSNFIRSDNYVEATCVLTKASVVTIDGPPTNFYCLTTKYIATWQSKDGYSIVSSPISAHSSLSYVQAELNNYPLNQNIECLCDSSIVNTNPSYVYPNFDKETPCNFYAKCFLNIEIVEFMQSQVYLNTLAQVFIWTGGIALGLITGMIIVAMYNNGVCKNCMSCCKRSNYVDMDNKVDL